MIIKIIIYKEKSEIGTVNYNYCGHSLQGKIEKRLML